jgi:HAD superfamily hydrolase (TIGR01549 family)
MIHYDAFFFDFDGVLADSVEVKTRAFATLFEGYGEKVVYQVIEHHRRHGGMSRKEKFCYYYKNYLGAEITDQKLTDLCQKFSQLVVNEVIRSPEIEGAEKFLKKWYNKIPCFIISAAPDKEIKEIAGQRGLTLYFKVIVGSSDSKQNHLKNLIKKYDFNPAYCLFFGDAESDYRAAKACFVNFIGILPGPDAPLLKIDSKVKWVKHFHELKSKFE